MTDSKKFNTYHGKDSRDCVKISSIGREKLAKWVGQRIVKKDNAVFGPKVRINNSEPIPIDQYDETDCE
jgi:hypothetical protein